MSDLIGVSGLSHAETAKVITLAPGRSRLSATVSSVRLWARADGGDDADSELSGWSDQVRAPYPQPDARADALLSDASRRAA